MRILAILLALAPSAYLAWSARDMPHFGHYHDDGIYFICARSIAEGNGYRILSLPDQPYQTKYPPLYPLLLSLVWKAQPAFPANLRLAAGLSWLLLPFAVAAAWRVFRDMGFARRESLLLCAALALNPFAAFFSMLLVAELMFLCVLTGALILAERRSTPGWALAAGIVAGLAFLTKTSALPLLVSAPAVYLLRRQRTHAGLFALGMGPFVAGWGVWARTHLSAVEDPIMLYYTNYIGYHLQVVSWHNLPVVVWRNLDSLAAGIGQLLSANLSDSLWAVYFLRILALAAVAGTLRLAKRTGLTQYHLFAAGYAALLVLWHYPPNERFLFPVFPLLLAGFVTEVNHAVALVRKAFHNRPERWAAATATALLAAAGCTILVSVCRAYAAVPGTVAEQRKRLGDMRETYRWIEKNVPATDGFLAYRDPALYLYTGLRACRATAAPSWFYGEGADSTLIWFDSLPDYARRHGLGYVLLAPTDFELELPEPQRSAAQRRLGANPALRLVFRGRRRASVYRVE